MSDLTHPSGSTELQTPADAKVALLDWSVQADAELAGQIQEFVGSLKATTRKAAPWAAGAALLAGLLFGRRRKRRDGEEPKRGTLGTIIRLAIDIAPLIMSLLRKR